MLHKYRDKSLVILPIDFCPEKCYNSGGAEKTAAVFVSGRPHCPINGTKASTEVEALAERRYKNRRLVVGQFVGTAPSP